MTQNNLIKGLLVLLLGIGLIAAGFFLFAKEGNDESVFWLGLISVGLMYSVDVVYAFDLFGTRLNFERGIAGLSVKVFFLPIYNFLVVGGVVLSMYYQVEFRYQLYGQCVLVFFLIISMILVQVANAHAGSVQIEQDGLVKSKAEIVGVLREFELWCLREPESAAVVGGMVNDLIEDVRYVSPTNSIEAREIDGEVLDKLKDAFEFSKQGQVSDAESILRKCQSLIQVRNKIYSK